jgi:uncharacterized protein (TIGR03435 family)
MLLVPNAFGQAAPAPETPSSLLAFEVATIKPTSPDFRGILISFPGGRFSGQGFTLRDLIGYAYDADNSRQVIGGPSWIDSERYDVMGKPERTDSLTLDEVKLMLQTLLAERFQLKIHRDTREMPVYVMTVAKSGLKMKQRSDGDGGEPAGMLIRGPSIPGRDTTVQFLAAGLEKLVLDHTRPN